MSMHRRSQFNSGAIAALATIAILMPAIAQAYVDPGTGGLLVQLVTGGIAGVAVLARLYWRRLKGAIFPGHTKETPPAEAGQSPDDDHRT
jgi:hypothetical protein